jgi:lysophospholipase L1-like esterase
MPSNNLFVQLFILMYKSAFYAILGLFIYFLVPQIEAQSYKNLRYLALGDSYTIGEGVAEEDRYPNILARNLRSKGLNLDDPHIIARTGWTTGELKSAIDQQMPEGTFDLVTLLIGVNNQYRGRSVDEYRRELKVLLDMALRFAGDRKEGLIVISIPDWGVTPFATNRNTDVKKVRAEIDLFNQVKKDLCYEMGLSYIDITKDYRKIGGKAPYVASDGLHPSADVYKRWVKKIEPKALSQIQKKR